jgi:hypothetical protein
LDLPFDDEVEDLGDRKAGFDQRKELLVENQEVLLSDPAPGGEGNTEGQVGAAGSDLKNIVAFCFELVPKPVGAFSLPVLGQDFSSGCTDAAAKGCHETTPRQ